MTQREETSVLPSEHYRRLERLYTALGRLDGALLPANADKTKWYYNDSSTEAFDGRARPFTLSNDFAELADDIDRTLYVAVNYAPADYYMDAWTDYNWTDDGREWKGAGNPMPNYGDLAALAPFADVDLTDDVKAQREDGDLPQRIIERALDGYIDGFAELCGGRGPVFALDSVGGAYVMVAPSVTSPIAERFNRGDRSVIFEKLASRVNDHLTEVRDKVHAQIEGLDDVLDPDMVTHKNRIFKAPLSLHADIDGVVTPLDTGGPDYSLTPLDGVDDALIEAGERWAKNYTSDYSDRVGDLVAALWPEYADGREWDDALRAWLEEHQSNGRPANGSEPTGSSNQSESADYGDTAPLEEVYRALDDLNVREVAEDTIVHKWNKKATSGKGQGFYPTWGRDSNGTANYISEKVWHDTGCGDYGTVVEMALIHAGNWTRGEIATGSDWVEGIRELRKLDYDVPLPQGDDLPEDASPYYSFDLKGISDEHGIAASPYDDDDALLRTCLIVRDEYDGLNDASPPYAALVALADYMDLSFANPDEQILGKTSYKVASRMFEDLEPGDLG